jgi:hypothetical protein
MDLVVDEPWCDTQPPNVIVKNGIDAIEVILTYVDHEIILSMIREIRDRYDNKFTPKQQSLLQKLGVRRDYSIKSYSPVSQSSWIKCFLILLELDHLKMIKEHLQWSLFNKEDYDIIQDVLNLVEEKIRKKDVFESQL